MKATPTENEKNDVIDLFLEDVHHLICLMSVHWKTNRFSHEPRAMHVLGTDKKVQEKIFICYHCYTE